MRKAQVFISSGQRNDREKKIGKSVAEYFQKRGFKTYFAERVHSSDALTENIFKFLEKSEYFVFIDFKRDKILTDKYRGSLFVNQEIAIATFLNIEGIGYHETGVKREGILDYHIYNPIQFEDGTQIISSLEKETSDWDVNSVNELKIEFDDDTIDRNVIINQQFNTDWYHLVVKNKHNKKHAYSCMSYITKIVDLENGKNISIPTNELIWAGTGEYIVNIINSSKREIDAFYVVHGHDKIVFNQRSLSTSNKRYAVPKLSIGRYLIEFTITSTNFPSSSIQFVLEFSGYKDDIKFHESSDVP